MITDKNGREVIEYDLIRVPHYIDARTKRKCYMYKIVLDFEGGLVAQSIPGAVSGHLEEVNSCPVHLINEFEIIDGRSRSKEGGELECWYERPKVKAPIDNQD